MHRRLLDVLCCPRCRARLSLTGSEEICVHGTLSCTACGTAYPVRDGIPVLLAPSLEGQDAERSGRAEVARSFQNSSIAALLAEVGRHHYLSTMEREARRFAASLPEAGWALDIGSGWGWHWRGISDAHVIALDFSFEMLSIARRLLGPHVDHSVHLVCGDGAELPIADRAVHGIWSVQTMQHMPPSTLARCLRNCGRALVRAGRVEIYWVNWGVIPRFLPRLLGRTVRKEREEPYYFRMVDGSDLRALMTAYFGGRPQVRYNEILFHPEIRLSHRLPLGWLDIALGGVPVVNGLLARQVVGRAVNWVESDEGNGL